MRCLRGINPIGRAERNSGASFTSAYILSLIQPYIEIQEVIQRVSMSSTRTGRGTMLKERPKLILHPDLGSFGGSGMRLVGQKTTTIVALKEIRDQRTGRTRNLEMKSSPVSSVVLSMSRNRHSMFAVHVLNPPLTNVQQV